jgi:hypothetical protein
MVVNSRPVRRALLDELAVFAAQAAPVGTDVALARTSAWSGTVEARRRLNLACQWLRVTSAAVESARRQEPVQAPDRELLCAIPVNGVPPRHLPMAGEAVSVLCEGTIDTAERVRHSTWAAGERALWSPAFTMKSLRGVAVASVVTSHNCRVVLRGLADRAGQLGLADLSGQLAAAADAVMRARVGWFEVGQSLDQVATDTRGYQSQTAAEVGDLALWTGRLAYAKPDWTLTDGPAHPARAPEDLAARPQDLPLAVAAVHQSCETLAKLASSDSDQVRAAHRAGRLLVPTLSLPETYDVPRPFAHAPQQRVDHLLGAYEEAAQASRKAARSVGEIAVATRAPSRMLEAARTAVHGDPAPEDSVGKPAPRLPSANSPGAVERALLDLGITQPDLLRRGARLDRASQRLIIHAAGDAERPPLQANPTEPGEPSAATPVGRALAASHGRSGATRHRPIQGHHEGPEPEP